MFLFFLDDTPGNFELSKLLLFHLIFILFFLCYYDLCSRTSKLFGYAIFSTLLRRHWIVCDSLARFQLHGFVHLHFHSEQPMFCAHFCECIAREQIAFV